MTRPVIIFRKADPVPDPIWRTQPSKRSLAAVTARLGPEAAGSLARARIEWRPAAEVLREANRSPLPLDDPDVARHIGKVREGKPLAPVVVDGTRLVDGEHRLTVAHAHGPETKVPVLQLKGTEMSKKSKKISKSGDPVDRLADSLVALHTESRRGDLNAHQRQILNKAARGAETQYLRAVRPWAVESEIAKADGDGDLLVAKAERIKKSDPTVSRFDALMAAAHGRKA